MESEKKIPYPKSVFFIIINEFCERFSYYGMKAILILYLVNVLDFSGDEGTQIYHIFSFLCYFTPLLGAMIADSFLGKFRTILYLSIIYVIGNIVLAMAATKPLQFPQVPISMLGLALIALGTGGIKPCVSAFGGDQFILPQQEKQLSTFFFVFYFSINAGSLISTFITPIFRQDIPCFGDKTCYPLAFGVPAALMVTALVIFIIGKPWYRIRKTSGNIMAQVSRCIVHAISRKRSSSEVREHFLDYADDVYEKSLIEDVKVLLRILVLYIPLPFFWALFDQQGSRWTLQATRMNGKLFGWLIKPDQMQVVNPFLILALIPIFDQILYPAFEKFNMLKKPLQRLTTGGALAGIAFIISGILELKLEPTYAVKLSGMESQLHFVNTLNCPLSLELELSSVNSTFEFETRTMDIEALSGTILSKIPPHEYKGKVRVKECQGFPGTKLVEFTAESEKEKAYSYIIEDSAGVLRVRRDATEEELEKSKEGNPKLKLILSGLKEETDHNATLLLEGDKGHKEYLNLKLNESKTFTTDPQKYKLTIIIPSNETANQGQRYMNISGDFDPLLGGNYLLILKKEGDKVSFSTFTVTEPNSVHMLWLLPQYIVITVAEVMFSVTGLEFSFAQAPGSMKAVIQAAWLLTVAFGNLIVVFITEFIKLGSQSKEFFLFAGLMFVDMIIFAVMAYFYKPAKPSVDKEEGFSDIPLENTAKSNVD